MPRVADIALAIIGLILSAPILLLAAIAIKLDTRGPVFYRQRRVGLGGATFEMWKLRTMAHGAPLGGVWDPLTADDPRITRVGAFLRKTSLDELPNLFNVLRGEMAIVGPRPTISEQVSEYTPRQRRRLEVKPGITGWAQINGREEIGWEQRFVLDRWYVDHWSLWLDIKIILRTVWIVLKREGISQPGHVTMGDFLGSSSLERSDTLYDSLMTKKEA